MRRQPRPFRLIFWPVLLACMLLSGQAWAREAEEPRTYGIYYGRQTEGVFLNKYEIFNTRARRGETIQTPKMADRGGRRCFWRAVVKGKLIEVENGKRYKVCGATRFCAFWRKLCQVRFFNRSGTKEYRSLVLERPWNDTFCPPVLKDTKTHCFLGWSIARNAERASYGPEMNYRLHNNLRLYAVYARRPEPCATFILSGGSVFKISAADGKTLRFPSVPFRDDRTCQGWSTKEGTTCSPMYLENEIVPRKTAVYYSVDAYSQNNKDDNRKVREAGKYTKVYFVGDSRVYLGEYYLAGEFSKTRLISKSGSGYEWLARKGGGYDRLLLQIRDDNKKSRGKKAVVFCSGINDMRNVGRYISFYQSKAPQLKALGCDLFVMSVNPFNQSQHQYVLRKYKQKPSYIETRTQEQLKQFNEKLKKELAGTYRYIDTYSYLVKTGWPTYSTVHHVPDGLHYTKAVTRRVFSYAALCMDQ